jgi:hypothetical protein
MEHHTYRKTEEGKLDWSQLALEPLSKNTLLKERWKRRKDGKEDVSKY